MATTLGSIDFDPAQANAAADPYPLYRRLRDSEPVHRCDARDLWVLSRFADVDAILADPTRFSSACERSERPRGDAELSVAAILFSDAPTHDRLRAAIRDRFRAPAVAQLAARIAVTTTELLAALGSATEADLARDVTWPLALATVGHVVGVPPEAGPALLRALQRRTYPDHRPAGHRTPEATEAAAEAELLGFFQAALVSRLHHPSDDLLGDLARAVGGGSLSLAEAVGLADFLFEGLDTAANLLGSALLAILTTDPRPDLSDLPEPRLRTAVEELIRYDSPIQGMRRRATTNVVLHGVTIPRGGDVWLLFGSTNRDERRVADPDRLLLDRPPRRTLAFGTGAHVCPGAPLARLLTRVALPLVSAWARPYRVRGVERPRNDFTRAILSLAVERVSPPGSSPTRSP
jgi:cytochrome P450